MRICAFLLMVLALVIPATFAQESSDLYGTQWQLVSMGEEDVIEGTSITLIFGEENSAGGMGGCNTYGGTYTIDNHGAITFAEIFSTMMACLSDRVMEQEIAYLAALQSATAYEIIDGQLVITYEGGELVFDPLPTLPETQWRLVSMGEEELIEDTEITLEFDAENNAAGRGGCNQYSSVYSADAQNLSFLEIISTEMACMGDGVMEQEMAYFAALAAATTYMIEDDTLTITYGEESKTLVFERVLDLAGTAWQLESIGDMPVTVPVTLQFDEEGHAAGSGGCNSYNSTYTLSGDHIQFEAVVSTRMACEAAVMQLETAYFAALEAAESVELTEEGQLMISGGDETLVFTPAEIVSSES